MIAPPPTSRPVDERSQWRGRGLGLYLILVLALVAMTIAYAAARLLIDRSLGQVFATLGLIGLICLWIVALYFAEGCEIAVFTVLDRDEDEQELGGTASLLADLREHIDEFLSGRQLVVLILVIVFAAMCEAFAHDASQAAAKLGPATPLAYPYISWAFNPLLVNAYSYVFPILTALWLSQLFSKFIAQHRPATFFRAPLAQFAVRLSIALGKNLRVGDVSVLLSERILKKRKEEPRIASRSRLYSTLAALKDGFGFERVIANVTIDPDDGSCEVKLHFVVRSYAARGRVIHQDDKWGGPIRNQSLRVDAPRNVSLSGPSFNDDKTQVRWEFALDNPMEVGQQFTFSVQYSVGPGGVKSGEGSRDEFFYEQKKYPVKHLSVSLRLKDTSVFMLAEGRIEAEVSDDRSINERESNRFLDCVNAVDSGLDYEVHYPLMGGTSHCRWTIVKKLPDASRFNEWLADVSKPELTTAPRALPR